MAGRLLLGLLYSNEKLDGVSADGVGGRFVQAFREKLSEFIDDPVLLLEYGVAAALDPRQSGLGKYKQVWEGNLMSKCKANWENHAKFL